MFPLLIRLNKGPLRRAFWLVWSGYSADQSKFSSAQYGGDVGTATHCLKQAAWAVDVNRVTATGGSVLSVACLGICATFDTATKTDLNKQWGLAGFRQAVTHRALPLVDIAGVNGVNLATDVDVSALILAMCQAGYPRSTVQNLLLKLD